MIAAAASGLLLNVFTDPFLGYFRNVYIFGQEYTIAKALTKITGGVTFVNSVASTVCVVLLYLALRPALERANLLPKAQKASEPRPTSNQLPFLSDVLIKQKERVPAAHALFASISFQIRGTGTRCPLSIPAVPRDGLRVPGRFPVVGRHGEEGFQLPGRHRDAAGDFPLSDGFKAGYSTSCTGFL